MTFMYTQVVVFCRKWAAALLQSVMLLALLPSLVAAQPRTRNVQDAIAEINQGKTNPTALQRIAKAGVVELIPVLHEQFVQTQDDRLKEAIASALVRLGDKDRTYWDFLDTQARKVVESDAPFPLQFDVQGKMIPKQLSPEFLQWAKDNHVEPRAAAAAQVQNDPAKITLLAVTGDQRSVELLRRAMASRNYLVQGVAASGLARLQDTDSVALIIAACRRAPADAAALIARSLVFFKTSQAQSAAETFIQNKELLEELRKLSREKGTDVLF